MGVSVFLFLRNIFLSVFVVLNMGNFAYRNIVYERNSVSIFCGIIIIL